MVTVDDGVDESLGVRWGYTKANANGATTTGSLEGAFQIANGDDLLLDDSLNLNLPATGAAGSIAFQVAKLADGSLLDLELSALETENKAEIIASPRVTTANQKEAVIEQGTEFPYQVASSSGATSIAFRKASLKLEVTPQITPEGNIILNLDVNKDTRGIQTTAGYAIDTKHIQTQVLVDNGGTVVIGGIFTEDQVNTVDKVPFFGDLPGIGVLFRRTAVSQEKREMLVFITPKVLGDVKGSR